MRFRRYYFGPEVAKHLVEIFEGIEKAGDACNEFRNTFYDPLRRHPYYDIYEDFLYELYLYIEGGRVYSNGFKKKYKMGLLRNLRYGGEEAQLEFFCRNTRYKEVSELLDTYLREYYYMRCIKESYYLYKFPRLIRIIIRLVEKICFCLHYHDGFDEFIECFFRCLVSHPLDKGDLLTLYERLFFYFIEIERMNSLIFMVQLIIMFLEGGWFVLILSFFGGASFHEFFNDIEEAEE